MIRNTIPHPEVTVDGPASIKVCNSLWILIKLCSLCLLQAGFHRSYIMYMEKGKEIIPYSRLITH